MKTQLSLTIAGILLLGAAHADSIPCLKPAPVAKHKHHKPVPAQSCVMAPTAIPWTMPVSDPEPLTAPIVVTRYQDAPVVAQQAAQSWDYPSTWLEPSFDSGFGFSMMLPPSVQYTISSSVTNVYNTYTSNTTNDYDTVIVPRSPYHRPDAHKAPELDASGIGGALTLLIGLLLVIGGKRHET